MRLIFAWQQPFTNDEGAYLFDAKLLSVGQLPAGDVLTKTPVTVGLFAASVWLTNGSLWASRLASSTASLLAAIPLAWLVRRLQGKEAAITAGLLWLLAAGPIPFHILGHTETVASFFALSFLALWWQAVAASERKLKDSVFAFLAGNALMLAFASRKTSIVLLLPALYLWLRSPGARRRQVLVPLMSGVVVCLIPWLVGVYHLYGVEGIQQAIGIGYSGLLYEDVQGVPGQAGLPWAVGVWGRVGSSSLLAAIVGIAWVGRQLIRRHAVPMVALVWCVPLIFVYGGWPVFLPEYGIDFLAPVIIVASLAIGDIWRKKPVGAMILLSLLAMTTVGSLWSAALKPWTGMFTREAIYEAAALLQARVLLHQPIFTAAVIVPYLSNHAVLFNIAHPLWYRYDFIPSQTKEKFLPPLQQVEKEIKNGDVQWALVEHLTDYAYLRQPSQLIGLFGRDWQLVSTITNNTGYRSNTLKLYTRDVTPMLQ